MPAWHIAESFFRACLSENNGQKVTYIKPPLPCFSAPVFRFGRRSRGGGGLAGRHHYRVMPHELRLAIRQPSMSVSGQRGGVQCNLFLPKKRKS